MDVRRLQNLGCLKMRSLTRIPSFRLLSMLDHCPMKAPRRSPGAKFHAPLCPGVAYYNFRRYRCLSFASKIPNQMLYRTLKPGDGWPYQILSACSRLNTGPYTRLFSAHGKQDTLSAKARRVGAIYALSRRAIQSEADSYPRRTRPVVLILSH